MHVCITCMQYLKRNVGSVNHQWVLRIEKKPDIFPQDQDVDWNITDEKKQGFVGLLPPFLELSGQGFDSSKCRSLLVWPALENPPHIPAASATSHTVVFHRQRRLVSDSLPSVSCLNLILFWLPLLIIRPTLPSLSRFLREDTDQEIFSQPEISCHWVIFAKPCWPFSFFLRV